MTGPVDHPLVVPCTLADLSIGGCAIEIETSMPTEPRIAIVRFEIGNELQMESAGRICWTRQVSIGRRTYGMRFRSPLSEQVLTQWLDRGVVSRREQLRNQVDTSVRLRRNDGGGTLIDAVIKDYSSTGFQIETNLPIASGQRIMVTLPDGHGVMAAVVWSAMQYGTCAAGCSLLNRASRDNLIRYFQTHRVADSSSSGGVLQRLRACFS